MRCARAWLYVLLYTSPNNAMVHGASIVAHRDPKPLGEKLLWALVCEGVGESFEEARDAIVREVNSNPKLLWARRFVAREALSESGVLPAVIVLPNERG